MARPVLQNLWLEHPREMSESPAIDRWRRCVLRFRARQGWAHEGVRLWLLQRPSLRWLPFPYPSVAAVPQWIEQAESQVQLGTLPRSWLARGNYTAKALKEMTWFRSRVGLKFAVLEDTLLTGILAARSKPGRQTRIQAAADKEEAERLAAERGRLDAARTLIGPRGGLPSLRGDLVKLCHLLHVDVGEKDTVAALRNKLKEPVAGIAFTSSSGPSAARPSTTTSTPSRPSLARPSASPPTAPTPRTASSPSTLTAQAASSLAAPTGGRPKARARAAESPLEESPASAWEEVPDESVTSVLAQQQIVLAQQLNNMEERFQAMFAQVMTHLMAPQAPVEEVPVIDDDFEMTEPEHFRDPRLEMEGCMESRGRP
jgi:hypothetical protein